MKFLKKLEKMFSGRVLLLIGVIVVVVALGGYSMQKGKLGESMRDAEAASSSAEAQPQAPSVEASASGPGPANPEGENSGPAAVSGIATSKPNFPSCSQAPPQDPAALLPKDENSQWAQLNPQGQGSLENVNLLRAGHHIGIDTVGNTLRNANLQVRSEPPNPQQNVGPWNNTTIAPDLMRAPLEIGCGPKICEH
jgi:hypothetical protein